MNKPQIVVHRTDPEIDSEFAEALADINGLVPVLHYGSELKETINATAAFQPAILMIQLDEDLSQVKTIIEESIAVAPDVTIVGICQIETGTGTNSNQDRAIIKNTAQHAKSDNAEYPSSEFRS